MSWLFNTLSEQMNSNKTKSS
jgi:U4/U6.U5 tri-snRNP-associated protein 2